MDKLCSHLGGDKQFVHLLGASRGCAAPSTGSGQAPSINSGHAFVIQLPFLDLKVPDTYYLISPFSALPLKREGGVTGLLTARPVTGVGTSSHSAAGQIFHKGPFQKWIGAAPQQNTFQRLIPYQSWHWLLGHYPDPDRVRSVDCWDHTESS